MKAHPTCRFEDLSYASHVAHNETSQGDEMCPSPNTVDAWRHDRMFKPIRTLVDFDRSATWLTVGDGRFGSDARRLLAWGATVVASDITDVRLRAAHAAGLLPAFRKENAETMTCPDNSFDFVLCKEAFHHFPRPAIAFYEMVRVSRRGVVLVEPNDQFSPRGLGEFFFTKTRELCMRILGRQSARYEFERSGNYTYRLSVREVEKMALGINLPTVAYRFMNDYYLPAGRGVRLGVGSPVERRTRLMIFLHDLAAALGLKPYRVVIAIIFKSPPPSDLSEALQGDGFTVQTLPRNPYLDSQRRQ